MATTKENDKFIKYIISNSLLDEALDWIANNLEPGEVFNEVQLSIWAKDNGFVKED